MHRWLLFLIMTVVMMSYTRLSFGLTANRVSFEFHQNFYRVVIQYTLPELKEFREAVAEFRSFKRANDFYWKILRGADFYLGEPGLIRFVPDNKTKTKPQPW
ncbi:MAG: hypothetical protein H6618_07000 [Deltaproteobacteria bacterium]|nr:hypothetical protein [Deltaproteobacteria bacterium]